MFKKSLPFATQFNIEDPIAWSDQSAQKNTEPSKTQQQFKDECDINILFARYMETGEMPQVQDGLAYGDFTGVFDYQTAMNAVRTAEGMFGQLPARIKNRFDNDPQKLLTFLNDPENREEAQFLGLIAKPATIPAGDSSPTTGGSNEGRTQAVLAPTPQGNAGSGGTQVSPTPNVPDQKPGPETRQNGQ